MRLSPFANQHNRALRRIDKARQHMRPWQGLEGFPWADKKFSERMLKIHLDPHTDRGTRRPEVVTAHVEWLLQQLIPFTADLDRPFHILDTACGPGLYCHEIARHGHRATGLDIAPAALAYARKTAEEEKLDCHFLSRDLTNPDPDLPDLAQGHFGPVDAVTWWFGDFHGFSASSAQAIIKRLASCLRPGGLFILEYQPLDQFITEGGSTWDLVTSSPFSDQHHLWLQEYSWHADLLTEAHAHWILEIESGNLQEYCQCHQGWTEAGLDAMLATCGLIDPVRHPPVTGVDPELEFPLVVTRRNTSERGARTL